MRTKARLPPIPAAASHCPRADFVILSGVISEPVKRNNITTIEARAFVSVVMVTGACVLAYGAVHWSSQEPLVFACYLLFATIASRLKVNLPGIAGTISVSFLFILLGLRELGFAETLALGCTAILMQFVPRGRPGMVHIAFNIGTAAIAIAAAYRAYHLILFHAPSETAFLPLVSAASIYFVANTVPVVVIILLTEHKSLREICSACQLWAFPYYLVGAGIAGLIGWFNDIIGWQTGLVALPVVYLIYRSYPLYLGKLEDEKQHVEDMASLHLRTIEALALAIEAKDHNTHEHLQRVRLYAVELAKELKVSSKEMDAIDAAALLHDIGKLAIPEHIISKPGRLTPEEFEKMKIHPVVGAEILERVRFPYPVVPIVRAHHEKWDGSGYPFGLKGDQIPIGARILAAVDFLDALASDRQYRRALPMEDVIRRLQEESGKSFDPEVVIVLRRRYAELEKLVKTHPSQVAWSKLSTELKVERGNAPAAGFEEIAKKPRDEATFLMSIAAARQEAQTLFELSQDLGASLSLDETLSVFGAKLRRLVPYDSIAIYVRRGNELVPEHVGGENFRLFASLRIPLGHGVSGWVAENKKPIINGNPLVEPGYPADAASSTLRSAVAVPLEGLEGVVGVLTLYHAEKQAFSSDHLRVLLAVSSKMALVIENALKYQQAESSATTDYLTGLPNARSLFLQLNRELARSKRSNTPLTVMVCDMDGFKQVNDRYGHLEGNRVLQLFARSVNESSREYDLVARMGGDEFVVVMPGVTPDDSHFKAAHLRELAKNAGKEICGEDLLSLSVGQALYPTDGLDAEGLLAEADRRMYSDKQQRSIRNNRRVNPRIRCRVAVELQPGQGEGRIVGILANISSGGCYVETNAVLQPHSQVRLAFSNDDNQLYADGAIVRIDPGAGIAIQFVTAGRTGREQLKRFMQFVEQKTNHDDQRYLTQLAKL
jgi:diguanylate cyclase (GGDEF)-like protein/putative nucleotidyltransferase with HDIG domain